MTDFNSKAITLIDKTIDRLDDSLDRLISGLLDATVGSAIANTAGKLIDAIIARSNRNG
jgi:hypothetical protein